MPQVKLSEDQMRALADDGGVGELEEEEQQSGGERAEGGAGIPDPGGDSWSEAHPSQPSQ